jgi:hypothetical protein
VNACKDFELLLSLRSAGPGALEPADAARLEAHLAGCAPCRAEADGIAEALSLARLPPFGDAERNALRVLPARALDAVRRSAARSGTARRAALALGVAAALAAVVFAPVFLKRAPPRERPQVAQAAAWQEPDVDALYEDADLLDLDDDVDRMRPVRFENAALRAVDAF